MRAFVRTAATDQHVEITDVAIPEVGNGEVLVAVHAFGVGLHDRFFIPPDGPFPYVIGTEGAGMVEAVGPGVDRCAVGDRVMVSTAMQPQGGTWAEYVVVAEGSAVPIPDELGFEVAAGIPIAGKSAVECLHTLALEAGTTLFVAGASGAIGTLVVQLAVRAGVQVAGSASASNHQYLVSLGAELAVDYHDPIWPEQVREWAPGGVDAVLAIQPGTPASSLSVVRDGGHVVTVSGDPVASERGVVVEQFEHRFGPDSERAMRQLVDDIAAGRIRVVVEQVHRFDQAVTALEKTESRHARGKSVVAVRSSTG